MNGFDPGDVRIGTDERQRAVDALADHFAKGRLETDEFEERTAAAYAARTAGELNVLFQDLPRPPQPVVAPLGPPPPYPWSLPAPHGREPATGMPYSDKYKHVAGLLQIFVPVGAGRLYAGSVGLGISQLMLFSLVVLGTVSVGWLGFFLAFVFFWCWIDGIAILAGRPLDGHGRPLR